MLTLSLLLGGAVLGLAIHQTKADFQQNIRTTTSQISDFFEAALVNDSERLVEQIARSALSHKHLTALRITNQNGNILYEAGPPMQIGWVLPEYMELRQPLIIEDDLIFTTTRLQAERKGQLWLEIQYHSANLLISQYQWLLLGGTLAILVLVLTVIASVALANQITQPLNRISRFLANDRFGFNTDPIPESPLKGINPLIRQLNLFQGQMSEQYLEMQQEVERATEEIQQTLDTLEIQNIELELSRKEAVQANQLKSEFLANMSHEMRTPLSSISGYTSLLQRSSLDKNQRDYLRTLSSAADALFTIIEDILDFAKLEANKLVLQNAPLNLRTVIDDVLAMHTPAAERKELELAALCPGNVPVHLIGDAHRLKQIFSNLVSNAIKFTRHGSVTLHVECIDSHNHHARLRVVVEDTGIGINEQDAKKLFQAFSQINPTRSRNIGGTGLGLVICKSLAAQMPEGLIDFSSETGRGSRFWFSARLPVTQAPEKTPLELPEKLRAIILDQGQWTTLSVTQLLQQSRISSTAVSSLFEARRSLPLHHGPTLYIIGQSRNVSIEQIRDFIESTPPECQFLILTTTNSVEHLDQLDEQRIISIPKPLTAIRLQEALSYLYTATGQAQLPPPSNTPDIPENNLNILAVDDNESNLKLLATMLRDLGVNTDTACNGEDALELTRNNSYDLVFMDIQMPVMDGLQATRQIRAQTQNNKHLPIIALTAHALISEKNELLKAGMNDYMTKPFSDKQLHHMISQWCPVKALDTESLPNTETTPAAPEQQADSQHNNALVDMEEALQLAGGRKDMACELLDMLLNELEPNRQDIESHLLNYDHEQLLNTIHKLHGGTRYCGVPALRAACYRAETELKHNTSQSLIKEAVAELMEEITRLQIWQERRNQKARKNQPEPA